MIRSIDKTFSFKEIITATHHIKSQILLKASLQKGIMGFGSERDENESPEAGEYSSPHKKGSKTTIDEHSSDVLKEILLKTDGLYEIEVHQLSYLSDVFSVENSDDVLLDVEYTPDYYGVFSDEISRSLQQLAESGEVQAVADMFDEAPIAKYDRKRSTNGDEDLTHVVEYVLSELDHYDIQEIIELNKSHSPRNNTSFGEAINFKQYKQNIDDGTVEPVFKEPSNEAVGSLFHRLSIDE